DLGGIGGGLRDLFAGVGDSRNLLARRFAIEERRRHAQVFVEDAAAHVLYHAAPDVGAAIALDIHRNAAHEEDADDDDRHPEDHVRVAIHEQLVDQRLDLLREQRHARRIGHHRQDGDDHHPAVRAQQSQQAPIRRCVGSGVTHGDGAAGAVAIDRCVKPSRPTASIAVTTAWCGVIASARSSTGRSWSLPATAWMARDSVDSSSPRTRLLPTKKCPCLSITITSVSATGAAGLSLACGSDTLRCPCCTKVVVNTKNINRVSSTSIRLTTLISNSSALSLPMRIGKPVSSWRARRAAHWPRRPPGVFRPAPGA